MSAEARSGDPVEVLLALGSNLGDRHQHLRGAIQALERVGQILGVSAVYETEPVGYAAQDSYLNAALRLRTKLGPLRLLVWCKGLEFAAGRRPGIPLGPRPLDVDLVAYGELTLTSPRLTIPHPRFAERPFMLAPLADVAPDTVVPRQHEPLRVLDRRLGRTGVWPVSGAEALWRGQ